MSKMPLELITEWHVSYVYGINPAQIMLSRLWDLMATLFSLSWVFDIQTKNRIIWWTHSWYRAGKRGFGCCDNCSYYHGSKRNVQNSIPYFYTTCLFWGNHFEVIWGHLFHFESIKAKTKEKKLGERMSKIGDSKRKGRKNEIDVQRHTIQRREDLDDEDGFDN